MSAANSGRLTVTGAASHAAAAAGVGDAAGAVFSFACRVLLGGRRHSTP